MEDNIHSLLLFPVITTDVYNYIRRSIIGSGIKPFTTNSLVNIFKNIKHLSINGDTGIKNAVELALFDFKYYINHPIVSKRKSTARTVEERISFLCDGIMCDDSARKNPNIEDLVNGNDINKIPLDTQKSICSNYREKGDIIKDDYKLSVKSILMTNNEINFGAFQFDTLFLDILPSEYLKIGERKNTIDVNINGVDVKIGRGSRPQLKNLFDYIKSIDKWDDFLERWKIVFSGTFKEDIIIYTKNPDSFELSIVSNKKFNDLVFESLVDYPNKLILNRWEGNSIRMDKKELIKNSDYSLKIDFDECVKDSEIIMKLNEVDKIKSKILLDT
jgi:hypothetical protein